MALTEEQLDHIRGAWVGVGDASDAIIAVADALASARQQLLRRRAARLAGMTLGTLWPWLRTPLHFLAPSAAPPAAGEQDETLRAPAHRRGFDPREGSFEDAIRMARNHPLMDEEA